MPARFTHTGYRYVLGLDDTSYAIWDRAAPEEPTERFEPTPEGWAQAWRRFGKLEPRAETLGQDPKLTDARPIVVVRPLQAPSRFARITLAVAGVAAFGSAVSTLFQARLLTRVVNGEDVSLAEGLANDERQALVGGVYLAAMIAAVLAWLLWQHRAHSNLRGLDVQNLRFTPGWAVGWWFIPFANLVMPFQTMRELDRASDPVADRYRWNLGSTSPLLVAWWTTWLLAGALTFYFRAEMNEAPTTPFVPGPQTPEELLRYSYRLAASGFVAAVAAVLAILVVGRITRRLSQKAAVAGTPAVPGTGDPGVPTFTHTGFRYVLGHDALGYGIWERERAGDPVERWGPDDASWAAAWDRFASLEPYGAALERPFTPGTRG